MSKRYGVTQDAGLLFMAAVEPMGHTVDNYGMYAADDKTQLTCVQCGILSAVLLNSGAADFVITGCGAGGGLCWP